MKETSPIDRPEVPKKSLAIPWSGVLPTLAALSLVMAVCALLVIRHWPQPASSGLAGSAQPLQGPGGASLAPLHLTASYSVIYERTQGISMLSTANGVSHALETPGYIYSRAVSPVLTPSRELIYTGNGIWMTSLTTRHVSRLAGLAADQVITSLALSADGKMIAWSSEPKNGSGMVAIYAGPLTAPDRIVRVYQGVAGQCPCFRVFSFLHADALLLTNDRGDHRMAQYGLWLFNLPSAPGASGGPPRPLLSSDVQQGPLLFAPQTGALLYSSYEGFAPTPDSGVPPDITSLNYANSLLVASVNQAQGNLEGSRVILPEQQAVSGPAAYRWVATPQLSPGGHELAYVEFASGDRSPFARHYALYNTSLDGASSESPHLLATASVPYIELGPWLSEHILTFYADNALYALDTQHGALTTLAQTGTYARMIAVVE